MSNSMAQPIEAWHFLPDDRRMQFGRRQRVIPGKTYRVRGDPVLCEHGLHASRRAIDALTYAPGNVVCRVRVSGAIIEDTDQLVASARAVLWMADATDTLRAFARWCALEVAHLWDMPPIVRQYLETGDESIRTVAWAVARDTAWSAAGAAARTAARTAAYAAAGDAAYAAARIAAWDAARTTAWDAFNTQLETMLLALQPQNGLSAPPGGDDGQR